MCFV
jgi:Fe-S cluster assembly scaffold IscU